VTCDLGQDNLSALDILSSSNLINYFGKAVLAGSGVGQIAVQPILLNKVEATMESTLPGLACRATPLARCSLGRQPKGVSQRPCTLLSLRGAPSTARLQAL